MTSNCNGNGLKFSNLTVDEVHEMLPIIDEKALDFIKKTLPLETEDPILVLNFVPNNEFQWDDQRMQQVATAMRNNGGQQISRGPNCFQFLNNDRLLQAKVPLSNIIPWAFHLSPAGAQRVNAYAHAQNPYNLPLVPTQPKIRTTIIDFFSEESGRLKIRHDQFFED